ncbi:hypothetical protein [Maritalea sp.]|uniref:hypothetical protein n=1 Tax=Maritalea sp. TaxID=2003361 RepID=UPI0039E2BE92
MGVAALALGIGLWSFGAALSKPAPPRESAYQERQRQVAAAKHQQFTAPVSASDTHQLLEATRIVLANVKRWQKYKIHVDAIVAAEIRDQNVTALISTILAEIDQASDDLDTVAEDFDTLTSSEEGHLNDSYQLLDSFRTQYADAMATLQRA